MKIKRFTPVSDKLCLLYGPITALVYGIIWRYTQASGECSISTTRLAKETGLSERSIQRHAKLLVDDGYIERETRVGRPSVFKPTDKIGYDICVAETENPRQKVKGTPDTEAVEPTTERRDKDLNKNKKLKTKDSPPYPPVLDVPEFHETWEDWKRYRRERRQKLTPSTEKRQLKKLAKFGVVTATLMIEQSIEQGWQGLFEVKDRDHNTEPDTIKEWLEEYDDEET